MWSAPTAGVAYLEVRYLVIDRPIAAVCLVVASPVIAVALLWSAIASHASPIFRSKRFGRGGTPFDALKIRTFRPQHIPECFPRRGDGTVDSAACHAELLAGARLLRALGIDELPQLLNVLRGEMALIGPRAVPVEFGIGDGVGFALLPGLTGLAQVTGRRGLPLADREMLNECYRANASLSLDLRILCKTLVVLARAVE